MRLCAPSSIARCVYVYAIVQLHFFNVCARFQSLGAHHAQQLSLVTQPQWFKVKVATGQTVSMLQV